jgi:hypothetical protein
MSAEQELATIKHYCTNISLGSASIATIDSIERCGFENQLLGHFAPPWLK